ncbi:glycosyltransferase family 2 protein [Trichocladium antarcticum]|uniref:Glycosyltransferase family 2 protein n=1 Tax=Trichocladium antarcticum TaxID=1450529 RepID=A0AAN6ZFM9_9PEZI|nr:glycosyltransferase family 2 protein [Trichocladium antarcticum]
MARILLNIGIMAGCVAGLRQLFLHLSAGDPYLYWFLCLFAWRYTRLLINLIAFWCYSPAPKPKGKSTYSPSKDVTVILPTIDPEDSGFLECLETCAINAPAKIVIVTAGDDLYHKTLMEVRRLKERYKPTEFAVHRTQVASKREQVALAVPHVDTDITVMLDDRAFWGPHYLETVLRPFEDPAVGLVGTNKRSRRVDGLGLWARVWNMLGATYLMRHNFEIRATNTIDGGVFVVSARTCAMRTAILRHPEFLPGYTRETFFFGLFGPLNPDDDNYNTRFAVRHDWKIKIQYTQDALMETVVGTQRPSAAKFLGQCRRWARTTWRSNLCSLVTDRSVWRSQPYCVYAVYLTSLTNFAAVTDPLLIYLLTHSSACSSPSTVAYLVSWIFVSKLIKIFPYFLAHPQDVWLFPVYSGFAYFHSLIKLWALLTFWDCSWSGRRLDRIRHAAIQPLRARIAGLYVKCIRHAAHYQDPTLAEFQRLQQQVKGDGQIAGGFLRMVDSHAAGGRDQGHAECFRDGDLRRHPDIWPAAPRS